MARYPKAIQWVDRFTEIVSGILQGWIIFLLMVMVLVEVVSRYIMMAPLSAADELGGYLLVAIVFMGLAYTWKEKGHVRVELVVSRFSQRVQNGIRLLTTLIALAFCFPVISGCYELLQDSMLFGSRSGSWMRIPLVYPQTVMLIGSILLLIQLIAEVAKLILEMQSPAEAD